MFSDLTGVGTNEMGTAMGAGAEMAIVPYNDLAWNVAEHAKRCRAQMVLVPWLLPSSPPPPTSSPGAVSGDANEGSTSSRIQKSEHIYTHNPFELLFGTGRGGDPSAAQFVRGLFAHCVQMDVALFVDPGHTYHSGVTLDAEGITDGPGKCRCGGCEDGVRAFFRLGEVELKEGFEVLIDDAWGTHQRAPVRRWVMRTF